MATNVSLTAELEKFARSCVESGRYNNVSEVVRSGLRLLQENEERRARFGAMSGGSKGPTAPRNNEQKGRPLVVSDPRQVIRQA